jgi:hypothetical protein
MQKSDVAVNTTCVSECTIHTINGVAGRGQGNNNYYVLKKKIVEDKLQSKSHSMPQTLDELQRRYPMSSWGSYPIPTEAQVERRMPIKFDSISKPKRSFTVPDDDNVSFSGWKKNKKKFSV